MWTPPCTYSLQLDLEGGSPDLSLVLMKVSRAISCSRNTSAPRGFN